MNRIAMEKLDEIVRLCKRYEVKKLDMLDPKISALEGPEDTALDFFVDFRDMESSQRYDAHLSLMADLQDLYPERRYVFVALRTTEDGSHFRRKDIREEIYAA